MDSAQTRFQNDQKRAAQAAMGNNLAARNSIRPVQNRRRPRRNNTAVQMPMQQVPSMPDRQAIPAPQAQSPSFDPSAEALIRQIRFEKLLTSPEAQDANTLVSLRDFYNNRDSGPDRGRQVADILSSYAD